MSLLGKWRYILQLQTIFFNCPIFLPSLTPPVNATFQLKGMGLYILSVHMTKTLMPESFVLYPAANLLSSMWCSSTGIFSFCFYCLQRVKKKKGKMLIKLEHGYMKKWTENLQQDLSEIWPGHLSKEDVHLHPLCGDCAVQFSIKQRKINTLWLCFTVCKTGGLWASPLLLSQRIDDSNCTCGTPMQSAQLQDCTWPMGWLICARFCEEGTPLGDWHR